MAADWSAVQLGELVDIKHGFAFDGQYFVDEPSQDVLVTPGNFAIGGGFKLDKLKYYRGPVSPDFILRDGDLIVTMTDLSKAADTLGYGAIVPPLHGIRLLHNQRIGRVVVKRPDVVDLGFLHWVLRTAPYRNEVLGSATGSTVKHTAPSRIAAYRFALPPLREQHAIAHVLDGLDAKIDVNRRINETLEEMARSLFTGWFVNRSDEASTNATDVSEGAGGWRRVPLGDALELKRGYDLPNAERRSGCVPIISSSGPSGFHDAPQARGPGVVTGRYGTIGKVFLVWDDFWPLNTALYVRDFKGADPLFALYLLRQLDFEKFSDKGAVPGINRNHVHMEVVDIPPEHLQRRFADQVRPWLLMVRSNEVHSATLAELRDLLLPKLLSGQLRIRDAERALEAVA